MEVIVKYSDFNEVISEIEIPISEDQRQVIKVTSVVVEEDEGVDDRTDGVEGGVETESVAVDMIEIDTIDDMSMVNIPHRMTREDLRDYIGVLHKLLIQMK